MHTNLLLKQLDSSLEQLKNIIGTFQKQDNLEIASIKGLHDSLADSSKLVSALLVLKEHADIIETDKEDNKFLKIENNEVMIEPVFEVDKSYSEEVIIPIDMVQVAASEIDTTATQPINVDVIITDEPLIIEQTEKITPVKLITENQPFMQEVSVQIVSTDTTQSTDQEKQQTGKELPKMAVSLNDKFRFINELFATNATEYNIAIEQINAIVHLNDLTNYLNALVTIYGWQEDKEVVKQFFTLARKRFS